jgi:hypothetical protein
MKIIALYPLLREELNFRFIKISILSLYNIVDQIIILIDFPNKEIKFKRNIFKKKKIKIYYLNNFNRKTNAPREQLLKIGRQNKGTHFIWLDSDEAFTYPFFKNGRKIISKMKVGEKIQMQWLNMWKKFNYFRVDNKSVWSNSFKDFIVCDHPNYFFNSNVLHEARTPGNNSKDNSIILEPSKGAVMHFQFVNWENCQLKQAWYTCLEVIKMKEDIKKINRKYFYTYFENFPEISRIKNNLIKHIPKKYFYEIFLDTSDYWEKRFRNLFKKYPIKKFEQLNIWHNIILKKIFLESEKRYPKINFLNKLNIFMFFIIENFRYFKKFFVNKLRLKNSND